MTHETAAIKRRLNTRNYSSDRYSVEHPSKYWRRLVQRAIRHLYKTRDADALRDARSLKDE